MAKSSLLRWTIYYSDSQFSSLDGEWEEAPSNDIQAVVHFRNGKFGVGVHFAIYHDYYYFDGKIFTSGDTLNFVKDVKYGKWMLNNAWKKRLKQIEEDTIKCRLDI